MRIAILMGAMALVPMMGCAAPRHDFDTVVTAVEQKYETHAQRLPMMGFVSLWARVVTLGGVKGMRIAEFDHLTGVADAAELDKLMSESLGGEWQRFVTERERNGEMNLIYVQPDGHAMRMLIADYEHGELDLVRVEVNADRLKHWMHDPEGSARRHDYGGDEQGLPD